MWSPVHTSSWVYDIVKLENFEIFIKRRTGVKEKLCETSQEAVRFKEIVRKPLSGKIHLKILLICR